MKPPIGLTLGASAVLGAAALLSTHLWMADGHAADPAPPTAAVAEAQRSGDSPLTPLTYDPRVSLAPLVERLGPAVVNITVSQTVQGPDLSNVPAPFREFFPAPRGYGGGQERTRRGQGSGFIISDDGYILTNNHVVDGAEEVTVALADEREFSARVVGTDPSTDVALVKVDDVAELPVTPLGSSEGLRVGDWVVAIGNPFGLDHTVTSGIVSGKGRVIGAGPYDQFLQTDASINPGNSGGPLFNLSGEVVGINTAIVGQGIGFAVPIDLVRDLLDDLKTDGAVSRGWVGVGLRDLDPELARQLGLSEAHGVLLSQVWPDTPAARAGLKAGDVVLGLEGAAVTESSALVRAIGSRRPGDTVKMRISRDGKERSVKVELGRRPGEDDLARGTWSAPEGDPSASPDTAALDRLGVRVKDARALGMGPRDGAVVVRVAPDGPAAAGLRAGDRVIEAGRAPVYDAADLARAVAAADGRLLLVVERRGAQVLVDLDLK